MHIHAIHNIVKDKMRKIKDIPVCIKAALLKGCINQGAYMQFHQDVRAYNLFEALLYAEGYEKSGDFAPGTIDNAIGAYCKTKAIAKLLTVTY